MRETNRKIKRNKKRKALRLFIVLIFVIGLGITGWVIYNKSMQSGYISPLAPNYKINSVSSVDKSSQLLSKKLKDKNIEFEKIETKENFQRVLLSNKSEVIMSRDKDIDAQIASLQFILARLTMEGKGFKSLDLRFDKPVIR